MSFIHYFSIINKTKTKEIDYVLDKHPEYLSETYIVQHKYDGANFQIVFEKNAAQPKFASRNCVLRETDKFFNYKEVVGAPEYAEMLRRVQEWLDRGPDCKTVNLFGELYGNDINKRVKYFEQKENRIVFFDVFFDGKMQSQKTFMTWAENLELSIVDHYLIGTYDECLKFDGSNVKTSEGSTIEGVVIKPYEVCGSDFYIKVVNEAFCEQDTARRLINRRDKNRAAAKRERKQRSDNKFGESDAAAVDAAVDDVDADDERELDRFSAYITENRAINAFGKRTWAKSEIKDLAEYILLDAKRDYDMEHKTLSFAKIKKFFGRKSFEIVKKFFEEAAA